MKTDGLRMQKGKVNLCMQQINNEKSLLSTQLIKYFACPRLTSLLTLENSDSKH